MLKEEGRARCVIVALFAPAQPGYLDFSYRVKALTAKYEVLLLRNGRRDISEFDIMGLNTTVLSDPRGYWGWIKYLLTASLHILKHKPEIVVLLGSTVAPIALIPSRYKVFTYWNEHPTHHAPPLDANASSLSSGVRWLCRKLMFAGAKASDKVFPIGEAHRCDLLRRGCDESKVKMIYMGVESRFRPCKPAPFRSPATFRIIYSGTVSPERGRDIMIHALAKSNRWRPGAISLTIVGASDDQILACNAMASELGCSDALTIVGRVAGNDIPDYLHQADIGICAWEESPWTIFNPPTKLFEYLVAGLPVLASRIRTHTEYIESGVNGIIFDYSVEGLFSAFQKLVLGEVDIGVLRTNALKSGERYLWSNLEPFFLGAVDATMSPR